MDFKDAFMGVATLTAEQKYTAAEVEDPDSPSGLWLYIWKSLGIGGKKIPLAYARPGSFASRTGQALMDSYRARLQLYVDDSAQGVAGPKAYALRECGILLLWCF